MREKPVCGKCGGQHWNYVACEQADDANATEEANVSARAKQASVDAARLGHVNQFAGARSATHDIVAIPGQPVVMWRKRGPQRWRAA